MTTLNTSRPRGMRDFYPEDFRLRENIFNAWRTAACSHGFEFVDAAPVEALALLERKSGEKISEQLYRFCRQDRARPCIALRNLGFSADEVHARFNFAPEHFAAWSRVLDKRDKLSDAGLQDMLVQCGFDDTAIRQTLEIFRIESGIAATELLGPPAAVTELKRFFALGAAAGLENLLTFDAGIVRGLNYYTGIVFEAFDRAGEFWAIFGGGRYETLGGPSVPCVGLGFGDVVIQELLTARKRLPKTGSAIDFCIGYLTDDAQSLAITTAASLRTAGRSAEVAGGPEHAGAFFGRASGNGARHAVLIGPHEMASGTVLAKDPDTGKVFPLDVLLRQKRR